MPAWFKMKASEQDKMLFRQALANHIAFNIADDEEYPKSNVETFKAVLPEIQKLIPRWSAVTNENFSTHKWEMHKSYADVLRSLLDTDKKLKQMVSEARDDKLVTDSGEGAEDEHIEEVDGEGQADLAFQIANSAQVEHIPTVVADQKNDKDQILNGILRKPGDKRPSSGQIMEITEATLKK